MTLILRDPLAVELEVDAVLDPADVPEQNGRMEDGADQNLQDSIAASRELSLLG